MRQVHSLSSSLDKTNENQSLYSVLSKNLHILSQQEKEKQNEIQEDEEMKMILKRNKEIKYSLDLELFKDSTI